MAMDPKLHYGKVRKGEEHLFMPTKRQLKEAEEDRQRAAAIRLRALEKAEEDAKNTRLVTSMDTVIPSSGQKAPAAVSFPLWGEPAACSWETFSSSRATERDYNYVVGSTVSMPQDAGLHHAYVSLQIRKLLVCSQPTLDKGKACYGQAAQAWNPQASSSICKLTFPTAVYSLNQWRVLTLWE